MRARGLTLPSAVPSAAAGKPRPGSPAPGTPRAGRSSAPGRTASGTGTASARARGWGRSAQQALALRSGRGLRAARLPAPLWLLGTNSGQSHDAGAARSASLPGAGGVSRGWEPGWEGQGGAAGAAAATRAGRGPHPLGWRQPPEGSASHWQTRTPPCPSPPPPPAPPPPAPRPVTRGRPDRHSLFPGAGRRPAGSTCPARRRRGLGAGREQPPPGSPPWASTRPSAPPRALLPEPAPRPGPSGPPRCRPSPGGKEGRRWPLAASPGSRRPVASLPKHTQPRFAGEPRRRGWGGVVEGSGAVNQRLPREGRPLPGGAQEGGRAGVAAEDASPGAREPRWLRARSGTGARGRALRLPARRGSVFRDSVAALVLSPALQGQPGGASSPEGLFLER